MTVSKTTTTTIKNLHFLWGVRVSPSFFRKDCRDLYIHKPVSSLVFRILSLGPYLICPFNKIQYFSNIIVLNVNISRQCSTQHDMFTLKTMNISVQCSTSTLTLSFYLLFFL